MATDAQTLIDAAKCYECAGSPGQWELFRLGLLQQILLSNNPMADTSPQALMDAAKCYACYSPGLWQLFELALLQQIVSGGGGGSGQIVTYTSGTPANPANTALPAWAYDPNGVLPQLGWNPNTLTWG